MAANAAIYLATGHRKNTVCTVVSAERALSWGPAKSVDAQRK